MKSQFLIGDIVIDKTERSRGIGLVRGTISADILIVRFAGGLAGIYIGDDFKKLISVEKNMENLIKIHRRTLESLGIKYGGIRSPKEPKKKHRITHCYCLNKFDLDNYSDYECNRCGWIICWCGACGCGFL